MASSFQGVPPDKVATDIRGCGGVSDPCHNNRKHGGVVILRCKENPAAAPKDPGVLWMTHRSELGKGRRQSNDSDSE